MARTIAKWYLIISFILVFAGMLVWAVKGDPDSADISTTTYSQRHEDQYDITEHTRAVTLSTESTTRRTTQPTTEPTTWQKTQLTTQPSTESLTEPEGITMQDPSVEPPVDESYPSFLQIKEPDYRDVTVKWKSPNDGEEVTFTTRIDQNAYNYYRSLPQYENYIDSYLYYLDDEYNREILSSIAASFRDYGWENGLTENEVVMEAIRFVQEIPYSYDIDSTGENDYWRYPIETLYDLTGDCEDTSLLLAGILRELSCNVCLLHLPKHIAVAIEDNGSYSGWNYGFQGKKYFYIGSTTTGWDIGEMPEKYFEAKAEILVID